MILTLFFKPSSSQCANNVVPTVAKQSALKLGLMSPWKVLLIQAAFGLVLGLGLSIWQLSAMWSAFYGAAVVLIPGVVVARGMTRPSWLNPAQALLYFVVCEVVKVLLTVFLLIAVFLLVKTLNPWIFLLAMVLSMKVNWLVLLLSRIL